MLIATCIERQHLSSPILSRSNAVFSIFSSAALSSPKTFPVYGTQLAEPRTKASLVSLACSSPKNPNFLGAVGAGRRNLDETETQRRARRGSPSARPAPGSGQGDRSLGPALFSSSRFGVLYRDRSTTHQVAVVEHKLQFFRWMAPALRSPSAPAVIFGLSLAPQSLDVSPSARGRARRQKPTVFLSPCYPGITPKPLDLLKVAPGVGFEPTTSRLTAGCSTAELPRIGTCRHIWGGGGGYLSEPLQGCQSFVKRSLTWVRTHRPSPIARPI